ncbi:hypothetical protein K470DRAFT_160072 [Piedraia hortae CBS 480.64]|uniref:Uncharacterized protein n=1 Tax=Piedraia hortae CBS 480.64 TaxID=1314780 RepID=A0A6A7BRB8_9PEZI|nr:hypothetical protein K470DRAFT_160072 [Piedraia hortae CBS 480.64]
MNRTSRQQIPSFTRSTWILLKDITPKLFEEWSETNRAVEAAEAAARIAEQAASAAAQGPSWAIIHADTANDFEGLDATYAVDQHVEDESGASAYHQMNPKHSD